MDSSYGTSAAGVPYQPNKPQKRKRVDSAPPARRSTNACCRCKEKKIKCHFSASGQQSTCTPCMKAGSDCQYDIAPDGVPRGAEYIKELEEKVHTLEADLQTARTAAASNQSHSSPSVHAGSPAASRVISAHFPSSLSLSPSRNRDSLLLPEPTWITLTSDTTVFNILHSRPLPFQQDSDTLPIVPSAENSKLLIQTVYMHTQARYCIVDWARVHRLNETREAVCHAAIDKDIEAQTDAYFLWIIYAIGAQFSTGSEQLSLGYYTHSLRYLGNVLAQQDLDTVQALLTLMQYQFRAPSGPSIWHLLGVTLRLCIELGYHRKCDTAPYEDPYTMELQKRFFWCTYCFDRMVSIMSKRPFGVHDMDIDVEMSTSCALMRSVCEISKINKHLERRTETAQSQQTRLSGPHAFAPTYEDVMEFLSELDIWRQQTPPQNMLPATLPHQTDENVQATYFQAALLLIRPLLFRTAIDQSLLYRCVTLSADACENARELSLNPQTFNSPITVYNCFRCGVTLLQCLAVQPTILPLRRTLRAISAVSSALAVYCRVVPTAEPLLRLFDMLSDQFLGDGEHPTVWNPNLSNLRSILQRIISAGPSETLELYKILTEEEGDTAHTPLSQAAVDENESGNNEFDFLLGTDSMSTLGMNLMMPFETYPAFNQDGVQSQDSAALWNTIP
ncbi:Transcription factor [Akanthomyces lecanii RCEF 1005]|uniref:Transcription factor n=1 Tax=Akanthomyces lecanii RCEF 1005 TaxID=1081108 RepID=A0A168JPC1_CORDF|nr:Transcription factor [Akanthomyces lecanii RCEF 1005]